MMVVLALALGCALWLVGLRICRVRDANHRVLDYWWALAAFFSGGLSNFAPLLLPTLSADQVTAFRTAPLMILGLALVSRTLLSRDAFIPPAGFALLVCFGIMFTGEGIAMPLASFATFLPAVIVPAAGYNFNALRAGAASGISLFLVLLAGIVILQPQKLLVGCEAAYKCSYWGVKIGSGATGNGLGIYLAAASAVTFLGASTLMKFCLPAIGSLICVELTGSRSGMVAWVVAVGIWIAYVFSRQLRHRSPVLLAASTVCASVIAVPFLEWSPSDLTFRPILWWQAAKLFGQSPLFGYGASYWVRDNSGFRTGSDFALTTNYSTHNIFMEMLISTGALGSLAFALAVIFTASRSGYDFELSTQVIYLIGIIFGLSLAEVAAAPGRLYLFPGILIYVLLIGNAKAVHPLGGPSRITAGIFRENIAAQRWG